MLVNVCFCFDDEKNKNYAFYCAATIAQMLSRTSLGNHYNIYVVTNTKIPLIDLVHKINKNTNWTIIIVKPWPEKGFQYGKNFGLPIWTKGTNYRLFIHELLKNVDKIAYFDVDVYFNCDVVEFYRINIERYQIAGTYDALCYYYFGFKTVHNPIRYDEEFNSITKFYYLNTGVILLNLKKMRITHVKHKTTLTNRFIEMMKMDWFFSDQDTLNYSLKLKKFLPLKWNLLVSIKKKWKSTFKQRNKKWVNNIKIFHYNNPKPWWKRRFFLPPPPKNIRIWKKIYHKIIN